MASTLTARLSSSSFAAEPAERATVAYDAGVLESMRRVAQAAFDADGEPILGLLLGRRTSAGGSVTAWLPATTLTTGRDANLRRAIELARMEYPGEYPIGWFRSKHQGEARLSSEELESAGEVIPGGVPIALVLRPSSQRPLRVASYLPVVGVPMAGERPFQEFFIQAGAAAASLPGAERPAELKVVGRSGAERFRASMESLRWGFPAGLLILIAVAAVFIARVQSADPTLPTAVIASNAATAPVKLLPEPLRVSATGKQWLIRWDARSTAERATLVIGRDGKTERLALSPSQFANGSYTISQHSGDLDVLLRTERSGKIDELRTRVVGTATTPPPNVLSERRLSGELDKVKLELQAERYRRQLLQEMVQSHNAQTGAR